jgi:hypothetical protein
MASPTTKNRMAALGYFGALAALAGWIVYRAVTAETVVQESPQVTTAAADAGGAPVASASAEAVAHVAGLAVMTNKAKIPGALALDPSHLYFADYDSQYVARIPVAGGAMSFVAVSQLLGGGVPRLRVLALDEGELFWATGNAIFKSSKDDTEMAAPLAVDVGSPMAIAVDKENVYWLAAVGVDAGAASAGTSAASAGTGAASADAGAPSRDAGDAAATATAANPAEAGSPLVQAVGAMAVMRVARVGGAIPKLVGMVQGFGCGLAVDATHVYWAEVEPERLVALPKKGGPARVVTTTCGCDFLVDGDRLFCTKVSGDRVLTMPKSSNGAKNPDTLASTTDGRDSVARAYAVDATHLYWVGEQIVGQSKRSAIYRAPKLGGKRERLTVEEATREIQDLVVGERWLFWSLQPIPGPTDPDEPAIMRMAK